MLSNEIYHGRLCVACDEPLTTGHKCCPRREAARQAAQTRALNAENLDYDHPRLSESQRLYAGLAILEAQE